MSRDGEALMALMGLIALLFGAYGLAEWLESRDRRRRK